MGSLLAAGGAGTAGGEAGCVAGGSGRDSGGGNVGGKPCSLWGFAGGAAPQATSVPTMPVKIAKTALLKVLQFGKWRIVMWLILLEALGALLLLVLIVWWTMFSGRKKGEPPAQIEHRKDTESRD